MTIEQLREYAAVEILGAKWIVPENPNLYPTIEFPLEEGARFKKTMRQSEWLPDQNRDQLWLVLEKCAGYDFHAKANAILGKANGCRSDLYYQAWRNPALALEAVCKAHQETK